MEYIQTSLPYFVKAEMMLVKAVSAVCSALYPAVTGKSAIAQ
jgi:hypothetical protein